MNSSSLAWAWISYPMTGAIALVVAITAIIFFASIMIDRIKNGRS